jgi:hypothetical protein
LKNKKRKARCSVPCYYQKTKILNMKHLKELMLWLLIFGFIIAKPASQKATPQIVIISADSTQNTSTTDSTPQLSRFAFRVGVQ